MKRFWDKVNIQGLNKCWLWKAGCSSDGYGKFYFKGGQYAAHRFSYELYNGPILEGLEVCHNCPEGDNKLCVNPNHLFLATDAEHAVDRRKKGQIPNRQGILNPTAKLNEWQVCGIVARYLQGVSYTQIAEEFNMSYGFIYQIIICRTWKSLFK